MRNSALITGIKSSPANEETPNYDMKKNLFSFRCVPVKSERKHRKKAAQWEGSEKEGERFCLSVDNYNFTFPQQFSFNAPH